MLKSKILGLTLFISLLVFPTTATHAINTVGEESFGVNIHLRQRASDSEWEAIMSAAEDVGVEWGREQFNWDVIEPSDNNFSWDTYDAVIAKYQQHNIKPLGLLTYSSQWASSNPGAIDYEFYYPDLTAWEDYVGEVAAHYAGTVDHWEIWNEPNHDAFWKSDAEQYAAHFAVAADAIKDANPDATVVLGGLSGADTDFLDDVYNQLTDKSDIDVVAVHPYRVVGSNYNYSPEQTVDGLNSLSTDLYNIKAVINRHGQTDTPIWITEAGWTTYDDGVSPLLQAQYLMRYYTIALSIPNVRKVFWYTLFDDTADESYSESQFGLLNDDYSEKLSADAFRFVKKNLTGRYFKDRVLVQRSILDNFIRSAGWEFQGTVCTSGTLHDSSFSKLKVNYHFTSDNNCYAPIVLNKQMPDNTRSLQFKVNGENDDTLLRVRVTDASGETFQYNLGFMPKEWLYHSIQLSEFASHWGGNNNGILDQPLTFNAFVLDDTDGSLAQGTVYFDELYSSKRSHVNLYRFHKDNKDVYAYWSTRASKPITIELTGAGKIREKRWRKSGLLKSSGTGVYKIRGTKSVKFLQTL